MFGDCGTLSSAFVSSERAPEQYTNQQEDSLETVLYSHAASMGRFPVRLGGSWTRVLRTLYDVGLHPYYPQSVQNLHPGDRAMRLEFCHWLLNNRQLLPFILFTNEATFARHGISNTRKSRRWSHDNPHGTVKTNFQYRFSITVCDAV
jgi:hypothetical protein